MVKERGGSTQTGPTAHPRFVPSHSDPVTDDSRPRLRAPTPSTHAPEPSQAVAIHPSYPYVGERGPTEPETDPATILTTAHLSRTYAHPRTFQR